MKSPPLDENTPRSSETLELAAEVSPIKISEIDSVRVRERGGQCHFDIVLKNCDIVTAPATDQNAQLLLQGLGFEVPAVDGQPASIYPDR